MFNLNRGPRTADAWDVSHRSSRSRDRKSARAGRRPERRARDDDGFTLIEVVIAISLLVIMMIPFADAYVTSLSGTSDAHTREVATMAADTALDQASALNATDAEDSGAALYSGRTYGNVETEWAHPAPGTSALLSNTYPGWDTSSSASTDPVNLPTAEQSETVGGQTFHYYYYVGNCYEPPYSSGGNDNNTCTCYQPSQFTNEPTDQDCAPGGTPPAADIEMYRVIVAVTWSAPRGGCGASGCYYVTSTLINGATDPSFNVNPTIPYINSADTDDTDFIEGSSGSFQVTTEGFPPPTYQDVEDITCTPSGTNWLSLNENTGLVTGTPPSGDAGNQYDVCITATNAAGTGTQTLIVIPQKATPVISSNVASSYALGSTTSLSAHVLGINLSDTAYSDAGAVDLYLYGPGAEPTSCTSSGAIWSYSATAHGNGSYGPSTGYTTPLGAGNYWYYGSVGSDINNNAVNTGCDSTEPAMVEFTVPQATPSLSPLTGLPSSTGSTDNALSTGGITTTMSGAYSATGRVTFYAIYTATDSAPSSCTSSSAAWSSTSSQTVTGSGGTYTPGTSTFTPTTQGYYWWYASYSGDSNNAAASTTCGAGAPTHVTGTSYPTLAIAGAPTSASLGNLVSGSVSSALSGAYQPSSSDTITYYEVKAATEPTSCSGGTSVGSVSLSSGSPYTANVSGFSPSQAGDYWWYAFFSGDAANQSACGIDSTPLQVNPVTPTLAITSAPKSGKKGSAVTGAVQSSLSGTYQPSSSDTITYYEVQAEAEPSSCAGGTSVGSAELSSGSPYTANVSDFTPNQTGDYWWYAVFSGDSNNNAACAIDSTPMVVTSGGGRG